MNGKMSKIAFAFLLIALAASGQDNKINTATIDELTGLKGTFLHYWGRGKAADLAQKVKLARGEQSKAAAAGARLEGGFKEATVGDYEKLRKSGESVVLDVRSADEFAAGHVPGAINIDINAPGFAEKVAQFDKSKPILVNCHAGSRGAVASAELAELGFKTVCNLEGGLAAWEQAGHQAEK